MIYSSKFYSKLLKKFYSIGPRDQIFLKSYGLLSFAIIMGKNTNKSINKNLSGKLNQKLLHHAKQSPTDTLKNA